MIVMHPYLVASKGSGHTAHTIGDWFPIWVKYTSMLGMAQQHACMFYLLRHFTACL